MRKLLLLVLIGLTGCITQNEGPLPVPTTEIISFTADPLTIAPGGQTTLQWVIEGQVNKLYLNYPGSTLDEVTGLTRRTVSPPSTTTYTLELLGDGAHDEASVTVTVQ